MIFKNCILSHTALRVYWVLYFVTVGIILYSLGTEMQHSSLKLIYIYLVVFESVLIILVPPWGIQFSIGILSSNDIPKMIEDIDQYDKNFLFRYRVINGINILLYTISFIIYVAVFTNRYNFTLSLLVAILSYLVILFPLCFFVSLALLTTECLRMKCLIFSKSISISNAYDDVDLSAKCEQYRSSSVSIRQPFLTNKQIVSEYLLLQHIFRKISINCGTYQSFLIFVLFFLMIYLIVSLYAFNQVLALVGFMIVSLISFFEVFLSLALANEIGYQLKIEIAQNFLANMLYSESGGVSVTHDIENSNGHYIRDMHATISAIMLVNVEIALVGGFVLRFKPAISLAGALVLSLVPRLLWS